MATTAAPYGFWATNSTKKLAHWVYLLGQPLSRNRFFQNFSLRNKKVRATSLNDDKITISAQALAKAITRENSKAAARVIWT